MHKNIRIFTVLLLLVLILAGCSNSNKSIDTGNTLQVHFLDVGQADCILIQTPSGKNVLIDAGNNQDSKFIISYLRKQGIKEIQHVIGTHPHEDHIGGLDDVIKSFKIGKVYLPKLVYSTKSYKDVLQTIKNKGLKITQAKAGVNLNLDSEIKAVLIAPNSSSYKEINDYSAVLKLTYKNTSFLFTGDAEKVSEMEMLKQSRFSLKADVLKVGHHGSSSSTTLDFLNAVSPKYAVISVGRNNDYGHPHKETIRKLVREKIGYFRTDKQGTVIAYSDGNTIYFNKNAFYKE